ncbi:sensor histidine kinase [Deinococcus sonorensis]|uniref:Sensor histidine kinase n=2 Tax=Deinococcus sonorensis TaxID=309891 RepID=A0AAU7U4P1_9DEIO
MPGPLTPFGELRPALRGAGLATWIAVSAHAILALPAKPGRLTSGEVLPFGLCLLGFGLVFWIATAASGDRRPLPVKLGLCAVEALLGLSANQIFNGNSLLSGLLLVTAVHVGALVPLRWALAWVGVQTLGLFTVLGLNWPLFDAVSYTTGYLCFQVFAVLSAQVAVREVRARQQLARVVEELNAARSLLAEAARDAERLRIARELHDLLGHHLTALTMNLQVADFSAQDVRTKTHLERASAIARLLLSDVREAVSSIRQGPPLDFRAELQRIQRLTDEVQVHAALPDDLSGLDPVRGHVLLRCVQEIITNAVRHGAARNVWLTFEQRPAGLWLHARDDGRGTGPRPLVHGCGLSGMRERLEGVGGALLLDGSEGPGFALQASLPLGVGQP